MEEVTLLYYSSNRESFEQKIIDNILKNKGDLPVVSVTQKPVDLGINICVGEKFNCYHNEFKQIMIGLEAIKTKYVLTAESDFLLPPSYFRFKPTGKLTYRYDNVWVNYLGTDEFLFKGFSDGAQMVNREYWLDLISATVSNTDWANNNIKVRCQPDRDQSWTGDPVVTFKTKNNIGKKTYVKKSVKPTKELPYWGTVENMTKEYL